LSEIGKSTLIHYLITEIQKNFDYVIWRNLNQGLAFAELENDLKQYFVNSHQQKKSQILDYLMNYRCLLIFDDLQNLLKNDELAGEYLPEYQDYSKFFQQIATLPHQSCLIAISWEKPRNLSSLERKSAHVKTLPLKGLNCSNMEILREHNLQDHDNWSQLIALYQGHPSWLNIISDLINDLFNGSIVDFLNYNTNQLFLGDIELILEKHLSRFSLLEKNFIYWLANDHNDLDIFTIPSELELSHFDILKIVQSLERRCLIDKISNDHTTVFQLNPVFKQYLQIKKQIVCVE
jgi:hypothetical protein